MIPKRVTLENFLSFGTPAAEVVFADDEPLWVLGGPNGVGKSAVFDAMTYCLFGCHRGGVRDADLLVRHGANGFRVAFEFEFDGADFRITRGRHGKTTQKVEQRDPASGAWAPVQGVNSAAEVKTWAERTLGLGYDAFQASVLLRQGEADKIINAGPTERGVILRKIIGADRYRELGERVHDAAKRCKDRLEDLRTRRDGLPEVTPAAIEAAREQFEKAEATRKAAHEHAATMTGRVTAARRWADLDAKRRNVEALLREADERAADEERIRADKTRLDGLTTAVPVLRQIIDLRNSLARAKQSLEDRRKEADRVTAALKARNLRNEIERDTKSISAADDVATLKKKLDEFPTDLAGQFSAARKAKDAEDALTAAGKASAEADGLLKQAKKRQKEFAAVGVGVKCSRCGQDVSPEHAEMERDAIAAEVRDLEKRHADALNAEQDAKDAKKAADERRDATIQQHQDQSNTSDQLDNLKRTLTQLGVTADADELRRQLTNKQTEAERYETAAAEQVRVDRPTLEKRKAEIEKKQRADEQTIAADKGKDSTLRGQLAPDWLARLDTLDADAVAALDAEHKSLTASGVADRFKQLQEDAARRQEWARQRDELAGDIAAIPESSRVPPADADRDEADAKQAARDADRARDDAKAEADRLTRQADERRKLVAEVAAAERQSDRHRKLDALLGKDGLQRELVRSAEREIVRHADDTVRNLSDGELSVELDADPDGADEAFALRVRRPDDPTPTPVAYLSGSQKFRVSVAVALAIGRYAAGHTRRLESVIIDEGFGSLDRDGLEAMATELNRLRQYLRRIVLVSHQEEFADRFPVVIKLTRGDNGTTAEAVRR